LGEIIDDIHQTLKKVIIKLNHIYYHVIKIGKNRNRLIINYHVIIIRNRLFLKKLSKDGKIHQIQIFLLKDKKY